MTDGAEGNFDKMEALAIECADARQERILMEGYLKHETAVLMISHKDLAVNAQEREARASPRYKELVEALSVASGKEKRADMLYEVLRSRFEHWRTLQANKRQNPH